MWKILETTARLAHCQRCTNCSRQYCTADYIHDSTKNKRKIRRYSEAHTRQQTTFRRTEWLTRNATSGESKYGKRQSTSRRHSTPSLTYQFETPSKLAVSNMTTSASWRRFTETRKHLHWLTKKATCSRSRNEPNKVILCQACFSTWFHRKHWKMTSSAGKRQTGMGIYLSDNDNDCFTNLRFADDVLLVASSEEQLRKMLCEFKKSTEAKIAKRHDPHIRFQDFPRDSGRAAWKNVACAGLLAITVGKSVQAVRVRAWIVPTQKPAACSES